MLQRRKGTSFVVVLSAIAIVAIIGGVFYFGSDVYRTKADAAMTQFSSWTPENIAKYPGDYLAFCERETKGALEKLKANEISIAQKRAKIDSILQESKGTVVVGTKALEDLKESYRAADSSKDWPLIWHGNKLDQEQAKKQILKLANDLKSKESLITKYQAALNQLQAQDHKLQEARDLAKEQLAKIDANREMLKIQEITGDLKDSLIAMKGVIETSVVGVASTDTGPLSLDEINAQSAGVVDSAEFEKLMSIDPSK